MNRRTLDATLASTFALALAIASAVTACEGDDAPREPLPDWSGGYADGGIRPRDPVDGPGTPEIQFGTYDDLIEGDFSIAVPRNVAYPIRIRKLGSAAEPCGITPGDVGGLHNEIQCVLDMDELDLFVLGMAGDVVVPAACEYLLYRLYMYENWPVGLGPDTVSWTVQPDGTRTDEVNAADGNAVCAFDHERLDPAAPNCCLGTYEQRIKHAETGEVQVSTHAWGGKPGDCYDGAAYHAEGAAIDEATGFPVATYVYGHDRSFVQQVRVDGISEHYFSTVPLASFYDPTDHAGGPPAAFTGEFAVPTSDFLCLDHAEEIRARIRLTVREWNEEAEFDADGDPDTEGLEPGWDTRYDDFPDWAELTPGAGAWPMLYRPQL